MGQESSDEFNPPQAAAGARQPPMSKRFYAGPLCSGMARTGDGDAAPESPPHGAVSGETQHPLRAVRRDRLERQRPPPMHPLRDPIAPPR
jgi:hypothetical protein